ncbi:DUF5666 domain-containing protein, partial [Beijerinckia sp. L45]|uniref:DUF5666 domain-containing protein n=1 Tax=Beijerinckia sp. L45 TaxID=1641855 RepID=UPI00131C79CA
MIRPLMTRRQLVWLAATALGTSLSGRTVAAPGDQGIGGTGFSLRPADEESDRGIGGTGVIGTIRKFGSIIVNDLRIAYPKDATVTIDGRPAAIGDLKLGQVVRVAAARGNDGALSTHIIDVNSEVVGPVERVTAKSMTVLGQTVSTADVKSARSWAVGETVAVSGLRRNDGTIVASLIQASDAGTVRVAGPVVQAPDGALRIGGLKLTGMNGALIGQRAIVEGRVDGTGLAVARSTDEATLLPKNVRTLLVEAYVERRGADLRLGSGLLVARPSSSDLPAGRSVRAVLTTTVGADGRLNAETVRTDRKQYRAGPSG